MFIIIGLYFTQNFTGVCLSPFWVSVDISLQSLVGPSSRFVPRRHLTHTIDTPFREYGIRDFHLCVPTTNSTYVYS